MLSDVGKYTKIDKCDATVILMTFLGTLFSQLDPDIHFQLVDIHYVVSNDMIPVSFTYKNHEAYVTTHNV